MHRPAAPVLAAAIALLSAKGSDCQPCRRLSNARRSAALPSTPRRSHYVSRSSRDLVLTRLPRGGGSIDGEARNLAVDTAIKRKELKTRTLNTLHQTSFLIVMSASMVAFTPLPSLTRHLAARAASSASTNVTTASPQARAVRILSAVSAVAAAAELLLSPAVGAVLDRFGRQRPSVLLHALVAAAQLMVVLRPGAWTICASRMVNTVVGGFLVVVSNTVIADLLLDDVSGRAAQGGRMGAALGRQAAHVSLGFLLGALAGGRLAERGDRRAYGAALAFSLLATLTVALRMTDSRTLAAALPPPEARPAAVAAPSPPRERSWEALLSSVRLLFRYGAQMRALAVLLLLQSAPTLIGDVFQVLAKEEWGLLPKDFANVVAVFGVLGIVSNISLPLVLKHVGLRNFSLFAVASSLFLPLTAIATSSYKYIIAAGCVGLYGGTQKVGTNAAMASLAPTVDLPQGQLQGEKAAMLALLKIGMPLAYGALYLRGKAWAAAGGPTLVRRLGKNLPFVFNVLLGSCAYVVTWQNL